MVGFRFKHAIRVNPTILAGLRHRSRASFLYRQPTRGGFSTVGTIVTIHRRGLRDRSSWTDRTMPKNFNPFKLSSAVRPLYWARRHRRASTELLVSTVCTMTSSGQAAHSISQTLTKTFSFSFVPLQLPPSPSDDPCEAEVRSLSAPPRRSSHGAIAIRAA